MNLRPDGTPQWTAGRAGGCIRNTADTGSSGPEPTTRERRTRDHSSLPTTHSTSMLTPDTTAGPSPEGVGPIPMPRRSPESITGSGLHPAVASSNAVIAALSQLVESVLGPGNHRATAVLDWAGVLHHRAGSAFSTAERHGTTAAAMHSWVRQVRAGAADRWWPADLCAEVSRASVPGEDHEARRRQAHLMAVDSPLSAHRPPIDR